MIYDVLQEKSDIILKLADQHGIRNVRVFGSVSKLEEGPSSDLDLLVDFDEGRSLFDLICFKQEVENIVKTNVDVVTENSIHWSIKEDILSGAFHL
ncbi:nucleotidyltransferase family protein [Gracilibacillus massiliensis]|uniref:nucleotidyltransferase family protein n=1 Tax=Gracilibacillus massiliensis TaxID=1564956 RepID=UPI00071E4FCA|nr:nucleotidyltransferase domain-containing protein [Gracilibacillus massiliensis]